MWDRPMSSDENPKPKSKGGRPKKEGPGAPWTIRGIHPDVKTLVNTAAKKEGMTAGEWMNVYVRELAVEKAKHTPSKAVTKLDETMIAENLDQLNEKLSQTIDRLNALENKPSIAERIFGKRKV